MRIGNRSLRVTPDSLGVVLVEVINCLRDGRHGAIELAATCLVDKAVLIAPWMARVLWSGTPVLSTVPVVWQHWRHGSGIVWIHAARETCLRRAEVSAQQLASASETFAAANTQ
jgi:hypothetical protein